MNTRNLNPLLPALAALCALLAAFSCPGKTPAAGPDQVPAPPAYHTIKEWIAAIQRAKPGMKLLTSTEVKPHVFLAVFQAAGDCLSVCLYDADEQSASTDVSFAIQDADGHDI